MKRSNDVDCFYTVAVKIRNIASLVSKRIPLRENLCDFGNLYFVRRAT